MLGVDDLALRRRRTYGTLLVDLERHQVVDVLKERTAEDLADWLRTYRGVGVISRDRSTEYTRGATEEAPNAVQIAGRWHLLQNLYQALERLLSRLVSQLRDFALPPVSEEAEATEQASIPRQRLRALSPSEQAAREAGHVRRYARYQAVRALHAQGVSLPQIAERLHLRRATVRKFVAADEFLELAPHRRTPSVLDRHEAHLETRFTDGCRNARQ